MGDRIEGNSFYTLDWGVYLANTTSVYVGPNTYSFMGPRRHLERVVGRRHLQEYPVAA